MNFNRQSANEGVRPRSQRQHPPALFTDIPNWTPLAPQLGLAGPIDARRAHDVVNAYSLAFFNRHLLGRSAALLDGAAKQYPDALFESRRP